MSGEVEEILERLGPARRFAEACGPLAGRRMAARGALPLPPHEIAAVLWVLGRDPDPEVSSRAQQSFATLPDAVVDAVLTHDLHPAILDAFALRFVDDEARLEKLALNPATSDASFCRLAALPRPRIVEIAAQNQVRLQRCPELLEVLGRNPLTSQASIDRMLQFLGITSDKPPAESDTLCAHEPTPEPAGLPAELLADDEPVQSDEATSERSHSLAAQIQAMTVVEKVKLARFGNKEARSLLLRDRNRLVATAAILSPKLTDSEVTSIAKSRSVCDDVLRVIASNREWTRHHAVQLALATNPKVPLPAAIKFLNYLTEKDLKVIMRSRDVPGPVSAQARRLLARKGKI